MTEEDHEETSDVEEEEVVDGLGRGGGGRGGAGGGEEGGDHDEAGESHDDAVTRRTAI